MDGIVIDHEGVPHFCFRVIPHLAAILTKNVWFIIQYWQYCQISRALMTDSETNKKMHVKNVKNVLDPQIEWDCFGTEIYHTLQPTRYMVPCTIPYAWYHHEEILSTYIIVLLDFFFLNQSTFVSDTKDAIIFRLPLLPPDMGHPLPFTITSWWMAEISPRCLIITVKGSLLIPNGSMDNMHPFLVIFQWRS